MSAGNITLNSQEGGSSLTLYANEDAAVAAGSSVVWTQASAGRDSPWEIIAYPGSGAVRGKFMGARTMAYVIAGRVFDRSGSVSAMRAGMQNVAALNKTKDHYTISSGAQIIHAGEGLIVEDVAFEFLGGGTGPAWRFKIFLRDLGA